MFRVSLYGYVGTKLEGQGHTSKKLAEYLVECVPTDEELKALYPGNVSDESSYTVEELESNTQKWFL